MTSYLNFIPYTICTISREPHIIAIYLLVQCLLFIYLFEIDADDEWKEWQKLGDPVLHIDLRGK